MWDNIIYNYLKDKDVVIPPKERLIKRYAGSHVKEPIPEFMIKQVLTLTVSTLPYYVYNTLQKLFWMKDIPQSM